jgi:tetratricopeptide (TPR) repeat protein
LSEIFLAIGLLLATDVESDDIRDQVRFYEIEKATDPSYDNWFQSGIYRLVQDDLNGSIAIFERIKQVKPEAHYYLGIAYFRRGEYARAALNFEQYCTVSRDVWQSCYYLSLEFLIMKKRII